MAGAGVTATATRATLPVLRALLDQARRKDYRSGVLGVRARPEWTGPPTFTHADVPVRVVPCVSALAVREALLERVRDQWLVVLTDRPTTISAPACSAIWCGTGCARPTRGTRSGSASPPPVSTRR